jgi:AFG3 family protein
VLLAVLILFLREDMIKLLGKRPSGREDDMDKWLDEHQKHGLAMPPKPKDSPPPPPVDDPLPSPAIATRKLE